MYGIHKASESQSASNKDKWALNAHEIKIKLSYIKKDTGIVGRTVEDGAPNCKDQAIFMEISEHKMSTKESVCMN